MSVDDPDAPGDKRDSELDEMLVGMVHIALKDVRVGMMGSGGRRVIGIRRSAGRMLTVTYENFGELTDDENGLDIVDSTDLATALMLKAYDIEDREV